MAEKGRPTVMVESTIHKLEEGFLLGLTDLEACLYANISKSTLYAFCKENPDFSERKEALKENVKMHAKLNIQKGIVEEKDKALSQWYVERKGKDEGFSTRSELTGKDGEKLSIAVVNYGDINTPQLHPEGVPEGTAGEPTQE